jgi:hypothetical protein
MVFMRLDNPKYTSKSIEFYNTLKGYTPMKYIIIFTIGILLFYGTMLFKAVQVIYSIRL